MLATLKAARESKKRELSVDFGKSSHSQPDDLKELLEQLFSIDTLNNLSVQRLPSEELLEEFYSLSNLLRVSITSGILTSMSSNISFLKQLKFLDFSQNKLTSIPTELYSLNNLTFLNLSSNLLTSLPDAPHSQLLPALSGINLAHNLIQTFPVPILYMSALSELDIPGNSLLDIPSAIHYLQQLKRINARDNNLSGLPNELSKCKIKSLSFESNPIKDRKLKKLIEQHGATKPKSVLDYLRTNIPENKDEVLPKPQEMIIKELSKASKFHATVRQGTDWQIEISDAARDYRPYFCCCIVKNLDISQKSALAQFLKLQADLHSSELSNNRHLCTIGTHDVSAISFPLRLSLDSSLNVKLQPLGIEEELSAFEFLKLVERESQAKQGDHAYLNKFISLMKSTEHVCYLEDKDGIVLSLAPITNCRPSMLRQDISDVFIEVSSDKAAENCRKAMDSLLLRMVQSGLCSVPTSPTPNSATNGATPFLECEMVGHLAIEQVRVVGMTGALLSVFPGRSDLANWEVKWC